ncbi:hypothetical protein NQ314_016116 [Rhamnusium bicolor]|uniref:Peptidase C14 caspase domain-containing protein n=1 Tax=Rhamnusium bicolor TaxID=1586634 RepID=A0AAV8WX68_9CUCU|nr:hypothetical protein NQ314_016116 [Rhamnusium bicolor]
MFNGEDIVSTRIQEIWNKFTSYTCLGLKNRPKIFIFQVTSPTTTETDSKRYLSTTFDLAYETPAEADMLIVYNKTENSYQRDFTEQLCDNINRYGKNEDIISLVTCTDSIVFETRPMIISTLTRKFYFTVSESRGYHLTIDQNNEELMRGLREVDVKLSQVSHSEKKKDSLVLKISARRIPLRMRHLKRLNLKRLNLKRTTTYLEETLIFVIQT